MGQIFMIPQRQLFLVAVSSMPSLRLLGEVMPSPDCCKLLAFIEALFRLKSEHVFAGNDARLRGSRLDMLLSESLVYVDRLLRRMVITGLPGNPNMDAFRLGVWCPHCLFELHAVG